MTIAIYGSFRGPEFNLGPAPRKAEMLRSAIIVSNICAPMAGNLKIPRIAVYATDLMAYWYYSRHRPVQGTHQLMSRRIGAALTVRSPTVHPPCSVIPPLVVSLHTISAMPFCSQGMYDNHWPQGERKRVKVIKRKSGMSKKVVIGLGLGWKWKKQTTPMNSITSHGQNLSASLARRADQGPTIECDAAFCIKNAGTKCTCGWYCYPEDSSPIGEICVNFPRTKTVTVGVILTISKVLSETRIITEVVTTTEQVLTKTITASPSGIDVGVPGKVRRQLESNVTPPASIFYRYVTVTEVSSSTTEQILQTTVESTTTSTITIAEITGTVFTTVTSGPTQQPSTGTDQNNQDNIPVIIGASIGGAGCIALIASLALFWRSRNRKHVAADASSKALMQSSTPNSELPAIGSTARPYVSTGLTGFTYVKDPADLDNNNGPHSPSLSSPADNVASFSELDMNHISELPGSEIPHRSVRNSAASGHIATKYT
ncbi:hypothetical protein BZA77DRAFT_296735 [Pyronema omphalodes]|nr:hypothetical protein BZA77DRAFT_296735 [Pyronema omphalodes]